MQLVYHNLGDISEADVRAMATYLVDIAGPPSAERVKRAADAQAAAQKPTLTRPRRPASATAGDGQSIFAATCNTCHRNGGPTSPVDYRSPCTAWSMRPARAT